MTVIQIVCLCLFAATYVLMMAFSKLRPFFAIGAALIFVVLGTVPGTGFVYSPQDALRQVDFNVLLMIAGTMGTVYLFIESKMPQRMSDFLISKMPNVMWMVVTLSLFAGIVSAFVDNVATVLMIAPVALAICRKLKVSPVPVIICIAVSSNLQGAATLVGDTTSILLAKAAELDFMDFFFDSGKPGMFWVVEAGAVFSAFIIIWMFRKQRQPISGGEMTEVKDKFPTVMLLATVISLIAVSFIPYRNAVAPGQFYKPDITNGIICIGFFIIGLVRSIVKNRNLRTVKNALAQIDYFTIGLLAALFIMIGAISEVGIIQKIGQVISGIGGSGTKASVFAIYTVIVFASVLFSAFIDNIPYTATVLPVVASVATTLSAAGGLSVDPKLFYYGLLCGATLGGNLTPIGASANIAAIGILRKDGEYEVKTSDFMRIGVPFTLTAVLVGYALIWLIWQP